MRASSSGSSRSSRPVKPATTSIVMSSAVGPSPPLVTTRSTPWSAMKRSWASTSSGRSPVIVMCASSTPSSSRRSDSQGPLRSLTRPVRTSVPVTTMPARALMRSARLGRVRTTISRTGGALALGKLLAAGGAELVAHRVGHRLDRESLAVDLHLHGRAPEVDPQLLALKRLRVRGGAVVNDLLAQAAVHAHVDRPVGRDLEGYLRRGRLGL